MFCARSDRPWNIAQRFHALRKSRVDLLGGMKPAEVRCSLRQGAPIPPIFPAIRLARERRRFDAGNDANPLAVVAVAGQRVPCAI
jgi:hypothetical protein